MPYEDIMNVILPPRDGRAPHVTGHYGERRASGPHGGSDFNYEGGQAGVNLTHPAVHTPVPGEVTFVGGQYGTIKIRDAEGNSHEILHTQSQSVVLGQDVEAGDMIGTMGGRGPRGAGQYAQHVHYQLRDRNGDLLNPEEFWRQSRAVDDAASQPAEGSSHAGEDDLLEQGECGTQVRGLQEALNRLGYRDARGRALAIDGDFGDNTRHALQAFQQDHGLKVDGIVGSKTLEALEQAKQTPLLSNPDHLDHTLYQQSYDRLRQQDSAALGFSSDRDYRNAAATLAFEAKASGFMRVDHVLPSGNGAGLIAVQGGLDDPAHSRLYVDKMQAAAQPLAQSTQQIAQEARQLPHPDQQVEELRLARAM